MRDSGFGIALPSASNTPLAKILSGRKKQTPQQKTQTPQSTRLTLASKLRAATRRTPDTASRLTEEGRLHTTQNDGNGSVTKRRKLNASSPLVSSPSTNQDPQLATLQTPLPQIDEEVGDALTTSIPGDGGANSVGDDNSNQIIPQQSTRKRRKKRKSVGQQHNRRSRVSSGSAVSQEQHSTPAAQNTNDASDEEDDIDSALKPLTPPIRKKRRVASLSATPAPELGSDDDLQSSGTPRSGAQGNTGTELNNVVEKGVVQNSQETTRKQKPRKPVGRPSLTKKGGLPLPSANLDTTTTSQDQPQRRKRKRGRPSRTSQLTTNKGRVQPEAETETNGQTKGVLEGVETQIAGQKQIEDGIDEDEENEEEEEEVQEVEMQSENEEENEDVSNDNSEIEDEIGSTRPAKATQAKKKSRARKSDIRETGGTVRQKSKPNKSRKKQKLPQRRPAKTSSSTRERQASEEVEPKDEPIPVTVHRISHLHRLNFIDGEDDDLAGPATLPKKSSVNAIDVLSQICREMIGKTVENLRRGGEKDRGDKRKAERRRKRKIVETFGDELDGRLFQMVCIRRRGER